MKYVRILTCKALCQRFVVIYTEVVNIFQRMPLLRQNEAGSGEKSSKKRYKKALQRRSVTNFDLQRLLL